MLFPVLLFFQGEAKGSAVTMRWTYQALWRLRASVTASTTTRSEEDNSLCCVNKDACQTANVRYITGTREDLWSDCMVDLQAMVSPTIRALNSFA